MARHEQREEQWKRFGNAKEQKLQFIIFTIHRPYTIDLSDKSCLKYQDFSRWKKAGIVIFFVFGEVKNVTDGGRLIAVFSISY